jgi:hypothetical protein
MTKSNTHDDAGYIESDEIRGLRKLIQERQQKAKKAEEGPSTLKQFGDAKIKKEYKMEIHQKFLNLVQEYGDEGWRSAQDNAAKSYITNYFAFQMAASATLKVLKKMGFETWDLQTAAGRLTAEIDALWKFAASPESATTRHNLLQNKIKKHAEEMKAGQSDDIKQKAAKLKKATSKKKK